MGNLIDIVYVRNYDIARKISKFFYEEGLDVGISNVTIITGTHGEHQNWKLEILTRPIIAQCRGCGVDEKLFEQDVCIQCYTDKMLLE